MSVLATALSRAMRASAHDLVVFDKEADAWTRRPWSQVHARAEGIATRILDQPQPGAVGLVGEPTADFVAAIHATWLAGRSVSILPGPVRGADPQQWAQATLTRFTGLGVRTVFSHGDELALLSGHDAVPTVLDLTTVAHELSTSFTPVEPAAGTPAILQGTAGSTGTPRTAQLSAEAVLNNVNALLTCIGVDPAVDSGCTWLPLYHDMGLTFLLSGALGGSPVWLAPTSAFTASPFRWLRWLSESGAIADRGAEHGLQHDRQVRPAGVRCRPRPGAVHHQRRRAGRLRGHAAVRECVAPVRIRRRRAGAVLRTGRSHLRGDHPRVGQGTDLRRNTPRAQAIPSRSGMRCWATPIPGMEIRVSPSSGHSAEVPGRDVGEIEIRGTSMMSGYLGDTALEPGAWFRTGDLGYLTGDGLVVCGRAKEIITVAGRNVFPGRDRAGRRRNTRCA